MFPIKREPTPKKEPQMRSVRVPKHWEYLFVSRRLKEMAIKHEADKPLVYETYSIWGVPLLQ
jgi:hypothetical protein